MRVLLSTYGSRGDVEPTAGRGARGADVRVCAPSDEEFAQWLADIGVPLAPPGPYGPYGPAPTVASLAGTLRTALVPKARARAAAVAGRIRTGGASVAATLLLDIVNRER
ncbi:hypothetical protein [Parafrankia sp. FMc2]|uniref:hypothetical protein n=1 Tax=Parafrankia sp. FMc2 TaxID=3233196 RepID=UPI003B589426